MTDNFWDAFKQDLDAMGLCVVKKELIERGLAQMKAINGPEEECIIENCKNHQWIRDVEAWRKLANTTTLDETHGGK